MKEKVNMSKKLYMGNLPYSIDDAQLEKLVAPFGATVSAQVIKDKFSGRSKGFGFVEMTNDDEANKAIEGLNGKEIDGRALTVNEARPMERREDRGGPRRGGGFGGGGRRGGYGDRDRDRY